MNLLAGTKEEAEVSQLQKIQLSLPPVCFGLPMHHHTRMTTLLSPTPPLSHGAEVMIPLPSQLRDAASENDMAKAQQLLNNGVNVTCAAPSQSPF